jgi:D-beta-D-heptose 7-phosphate kinase/D-beta-D-heptose 1-phosphate adenosyltransferase
MVKVSGAFSHLLPIKVMVIGDFLLDQYTIGKVLRLSPEAPVGVLKVDREKFLAGGAGNVVLNFASLGAQVFPVGRVGDDFGGRELILCLKREGIDIDGFVEDAGYLTPLKNRFIADAQQLLRVDRESVAPMNAALEEEALKKAFRLMQKIDIIAISDYRKGFLSKKLVASIIEEAKQRGVAVIVDPKSDDFSMYCGATIIKPNLSEAYQAAKLSKDEPLDKVADILLEKTQAKYLFITKSEKGISLFDKSRKRQDFPVIAKEVKDVTGAGDTVLAMLTLSVANQIDISMAAKLCNIAGGMVIERMGCVRLTLADLAERLLELDANNKIFEEDHLSTLKFSLKGKRVAVLGLERFKGVTIDLFKALKKLKSQHDKLLIYITEASCNDDFIALLSSLKEIDFIILHKESLKNLCNVISPNSVYMMQGDKLTSLGQDAEHLLQKLWSVKKDADKVG